MNPIRLSLLLSVVLLYTLFASEPSWSADVPSQAIVEQGELIFSDDFERTELGEWDERIPTFRVQDGVLRAEQGRDDHGAVGRVYRPMQNVICRVAFSPSQIRLGDDKEGVMRNDSFEMRRDPERKDQAEKLLVGRGSAQRVSVEPQQWHDVRIEIMDDQMRVVMNGEPVGYLRSPGLAHDTKTSVHFTVNGTGVLFDEVRLATMRA